MQSFIRSMTLAGIFAVPAVVFIVSETMFFPYITGKNFTFRILVEIITIGWVLLALRDAAYRPKRSVIVGLFAALLVAMAISDTLSPSPLKSFMSNFERMDGFVTLAHTFLYFVVVSCVIRGQMMWRVFLGWLVALAAMLSVVGIMQASGSAAISQGTSWRIDGTLGNSTYMAVYMLFSMAIAGMYALREKVAELKWGSVVLLAIFTVLMFQTGTRGTVVGLVGGAAVALTYLAVVGRSQPKLRKVAVGLLIAGLALVGGFLAVRDTAFVKNTPALDRLNQISLKEGGYRFVNWGMAWEGVKEKPVFGWGHESFNYVFNKHYDPAMYGAEEWYDRAHNILFDWLVQGGFVGATLYFGLIAMALWILARRKTDENGVSWSLVERSILIALLVAYTIHNFFVFDNVVSYIYFAIILAYIHQHVAEKPMLSWSVMTPGVWTQIAVPPGVVALIAAVYAVNVPGIAAARAIIRAYVASTPAAQAAAFEEAIAERSFASQEVREQLLMFVPKGVAAAGTDEAMKQRLIDLGAREIAVQIAEKPGDARLHILAGGFYRSIGNYDEAMKQYMIGLELSPMKTSLKHEIATTYLMQDQFDKALAYAKEAYEQDTSKARARMVYATVAVVAGDMKLAQELLSDQAAFDAGVSSDFLASALYEKKQFETLQQIYTERVKREPKNYAHRKSLAILFYNDGKIGRAVEVLQQTQTELTLDAAQGKEVAAMLAELEKLKK